MTTHAQRIAAVEELLEVGGAPLSDSQKVLTLRAALASAQADRARLEKALAAIAKLRPAADVYQAYDQFYEARKSARLALGMVTE